MPLQLKPNYSTSFISRPPLSPAERSFADRVTTHFEPPRRLSFFGRWKLFFFLYRDARSVGYTRLGAWRAARKSY